MTRIRWTPEETLELARGVALIQESDTKISQVEALRQAQRSLPKNRQRAKLVAMSMATGVRDLVPQCMQQLTEARAAAAQEAARIKEEAKAQREAAAAAKAQAKAEAAAQVGAEADRGEAFPPPQSIPPAPAFSSSTILAFPVDQLVPFSELETAISQMFRRAMFRAFTNETPPSARAGVPNPATETSAYGTPHASSASANGSGAAALGKLGEFNMSPVPIPTPKTPALSVVPRHSPEPIPAPGGGPRLTRVVLVGLKDTVAKFVIEDFKGRFDIRSFDADAHEAMEGALVGADLAVVCTKFIAHRDMELVRNRAKDWARLKGGMSDVKTFLTERWNKQQQKLTAEAIGDVQRIAM